MQHLLARGSQGSAVAQLRRAQARELGDDAQGYPRLGSGALLDADVETAARRWQSGVGLVADGDIGPAWPRRPAAGPGHGRRLHLRILLSDRVQRNGSTAGVYRKSLLYLVSNAFEVDLRTPILGLENAFKPDCPGWDGTVSSGDTLKTWRRAAAVANLAGSGRLTVVDADRLLTALPAHRIAAAHGNFDNDLATVGATLTGILGGPPPIPVDDLRGF